VRVIRVLVADDQQLLRAGFRVILEAEPDIEVVGEAVDGVHAVELAGSTRPDVVLMDIRMPRLDGLAATEQLMRRPDPPRVVVLTTFDQNEYVVRALRAGAYGFLLKDAPPSRMIAAIRAAASGEALIEPSITRRLIERFAVTEPAATAPTVLHSLTDRERDVLRLVAQGEPTRRIAGQLGISRETVETHIRAGMRKLGARTRTEAAALAFEELA
jgi:DNA-binding NarL/FixJ family response regulator